MRPDPDRQPTTLNAKDQLAFMRIVNHETNKHGRRIIAKWARTEHMNHPGIEQLLTRTLDLMWHTPTNKPGE